MNAQYLKKSILASEGRVLLSENVTTRASFVGDATNSELARSFGADMILLNGLDVLKPKIYGLENKPDKTLIDQLHYLVSCPIGVNLESVDANVNMVEDR